MIAQHALDAADVEHGLAGDRVAPHVRQRRGHHRQVAAGHQDRALPEVDVERLLGLLVHQAEIEQQMRDRAVAVAGPTLRLEHRLVDRTVSGRRRR